MSPSPPTSPLPRSPLPGPLACISQGSRREAQQRGLEKCGLGFARALCWLTFLGLATALTQTPSPPAPTPSTPPLAKASLYSPTTLVIFNRTVPDSESLARYYAAARQIPLRNLIPLDCPSDETITRAQYTETIAEPLRKKFLDEGWWMPERDAATGRQSLRSQFHILTLVHGLPLRIADDSGRTPESEPLSGTGASVDSELATLGRAGTTLQGPAPNPYHRSETPFHSAKMPMQLVGRIDAPSLNRCRAMIDETILAETKGLWGQAYIDLDERQPLGNDWLRAAADAWRKLGIPVTVNTQPGAFPSNYPMRDPILYFGWHSDQVNGPFLNPAFKFQPGAVACHIHSLNAATLRSTTRNWAGPLLARGAAAVLGTVDEPYLQLSHDVGIFSDRLSRGFTFIESAFASTNSLSWMTVAVGDPLYCPFPNPHQPIDPSRFGPDQSTPYKILRLAYESWGEGKPLPAADSSLFYKLEMASAKTESPELMEHLALAALERGDLDDARIQFLRGKNAYQDPRDKLRMELHIGCMEWTAQERLGALQTFRNAAAEFADLSEAKAARELMERVGKPEGTDDK